MDYLKLPLKARLAKRAKAPKAFAKYAQACGGIWTNDGKAPARDKDGTIFSDNLGGHRLRFVGFADKVCPHLQHSGWFVTEDGWTGELARGMVFRLPASRGFLAAYSNPWNDGPHNLSLEVHETEREAALAADRLAEIYGEFCRGDEAKQRAESRADEIRSTELPNLRESIRELIAGIRESVLAPAVCKELRASIKRKLAQKAELHNELEELA